MKEIHGYWIENDLKSDKSGFAKWGFALKNNKSYFIKEFLTPTYPLDGTALSAERIISERKMCLQFEEEKREFYQILDKCAMDGNVVTVSDFFRNDSKYYIVTEKIDAAPFDPVDISKSDFEQKLLIMKIILHAMTTLHKNGIVHGDIKPENILFKRTEKGVLTAKIIDFDSSFLEAKPPKDEELQGDMVYFAPESFFLVAGQDITLTHKIDVFALGILFHQYFAGRIPYFDESEYEYAYEAVLDGAEIKMDDSMPEFLKTVLMRMIDKEPENRPELEEVLKVLLENSSEPKEEAVKEPPKPRFIGLMGKNSFNR